MSSLTASQTESRRRAKKSLMQKRKSNISADRASTPSSRYNNMAPNAPQSGGETSAQGNWATRLQVNTAVNFIIIAGILAVYAIIFIAYFIFTKIYGTRLEITDLFLPFKMANFLLLSLAMVALLLCNFYYIAVKNNNLTMFHSEFYVMVSVDLIVVFFLFFLTYSRLFSKVFKFLYATQPFKGQYPNDAQNYFNIIYQSLSLEQFTVFRGVIYIVFCGVAKLLPFMLDMNKESIQNKSGKI